MALHLDIDAHGRVVPQGDPARRALADRAGRFVLLPSTEDLLVARRVPATSGPGAPPRCIVAGDLAAFPIADFIAFVHQSRLSGVLTVSSAGAERRIGFQGGEVRSAHSSAPGERVGEVAVRLGFATEGQVAEATRSDKPLGRALVDLGVLKPNDLYKCLQEQIGAVFHALLLSKSGTFALVDEGPAEAAVPMSVSTQSLLMDGIRRIDELSMFKSRIPSAGAVLRRRQPARSTTLRPTENALLALVDGQRSVAEIATASHLSEFDATKILFHLAESGRVEAVASQGGGGSPAATVAAVVAGANELLRAVATAVPAGARAQFLDAAQAFLFDDASPHAAVLRGLQVAGDGSVDEARVEAALTRLDPAILRAQGPGGHARVAFEALREAVFFWLFLVGGRVPRDTDEALGRAAKRRLAELEALVVAPA
jgi:hypothetical protein